MDSKEQSTIPVYTIDADALMVMFDPDEALFRGHVGLWGRSESEIEVGRVVSHVEVLNEIRKDSRKGQDLYEWAHGHKHIFKDYDWECEARVIKMMSPKLRGFVDGGKIKPTNADPWLIAQAKCLGLTLVSQEKPTLGTGAIIQKIPNVCADPIFKVECINLVGMIRKEGWRFT
ncbi:MAG TPA: DUF4411 family protein [Verrucomicrobiae bacterium]|nr:DUF4411 family protein [Verrucomicrobiae bacterium]